MRSPKLSHNNYSGRTARDYHRYYAGYSSSFVGDVLDRYATRNSRVLDPWNGSGTTTFACASAGIESCGSDINPATLPIAWGRLARRDLVEQFVSRIGVSRLSTTQADSQAGPGEFLSTFVSEDT